MASPGHGALSALRAATRSPVPGGTARSLRKSPVRGMDGDGDGTVTAAELLAAFDADGSGALEGMELQKLGIQLTNQVRNPLPASMSARGVCVALGGAQSGTCGCSGQRLGRRETPQAHACHTQPPTRRRSWCTTTTCWSRSKAWNKHSCNTSVPCSSATPR